MKTILVPIDFSPISRRVLAEALALAQATHSRLTILHAVKSTGVVRDLGPLVGDALQLTAKVGGEARRKLHRMEHRLAGSGVAVETICEPGKPVEVILDAAKKLRPKFLVMGSHGHSALYDLVVGSTTGGVIHGAKCPVLVVPAISPRKPSRRVAYPTTA